MPPDARPPVFDRADPPPMVDHETEADAFTTAIDGSGWRCLYVHGPRGTGKTRLARTTLDTSAATVTTCYIPCITYDTQFKILQRLAAAITGEDPNSGYHTAQLQDRLRQHLSDRTTVIVLDDLEFLLDRDGADLLYFLSRLDSGTDLCLIGLSASYSTLATVIDDRCYSSLQPRSLHVAPYTEAQAAQILSKWVRAAPLEVTVEEAALTWIAATTTNITLGLHWLAAAATVTAERVTPGVIETVQRAAVHRYREAVLAAFTPHHTLLLEAIDQLTTDESTVTTGAVYDQYAELRRTTAEPPLTTRRLGDFITQLECLGLIDVTHHRGRKQGKTRTIRPAPLEQL